MKEGSMGILQHEKDTIHHLLLKDDVVLTPNKEENTHRHMSVWNEDLGKLGPNINKYKTYKSKNINIK